MFSLNSLSPVREALSAITANLFVFFKLTSLCPYFFSSFPITLALLIKPVRSKVVGEHALPVAFYGIVDRMPVPVFNHACTVCDVAYGLKPQLSRIRKPWVISGCLGLKYQIIITFYASCNIAAGGNLAAAQTALGRVIYIAACDIPYTWQPRTD